MRRREHRWADSEDSVVANDREESRSARRYDKTDYTRVGGVLRDADEVPHPSDVADLGD